MDMHWWPSSNSGELWMSGYQTCFGNGSWNLFALDFPKPQSCLHSKGAILLQSWVWFPAGLPSEACGQKLLVILLYLCRMLSILEESFPVCKASALEPGIKVIHFRIVISGVARVEDCFNLVHDCIPWTVSECLEDSLNGIPWSSCSKCLAGPRAPRQQRLWEGSLFSDFWIVNEGSLFWEWNQQRGFLPETEAVLHCGATANPGMLSYSSGLRVLSSKEWPGRVGWTATAWSVASSAMGMGSFLEPLGRQQSSHSSSLGMPYSSVRASCSWLPLSVWVQQLPHLHRAVLSSCSKWGGWGWEDPCLQFCHLQFWDKKS